MIAQTIAVMVRDSLAGFAMVLLIRFGWQRGGLSQTDGGHEHCGGMLG